MSCSTPPNPQLIQLATIMTDQCLEVKPREKVTVYTSTHLGLPLATAVYQRLIDLGAHPSLDIGHEAATAYFFLHANSDQLSAYPARADFDAGHFDKFIQIIAEENTHYLNEVETSKMMQRAVLMKSGQPALFVAPRRTLNGRPDNRPVAFQPYRP